MRGGPGPAPTRRGGPCIGHRAGREGGDPPMTRGTYYDMRATPLRRHRNSN